MRISTASTGFATGLIALTLLTACPGDDTSDNGDETGETDTGDGDGDTTGDGDGDTTGDGDGDATGDGDGDTEDPVLSDLTVNVSYEGEQTGTLSIAALTSFPPVGPPLAFVSDPEPTFPYSGVLMGLEPGDYYITAILDIGSDNPMSPGDEDLVAVTLMPITITGEGEPMPVDLALMDP